MIHLLKCKGKAATKKAKENFAFQGRKEKPKEKKKRNAENVKKKTKRQLSEDSCIRTFFRII